MLKGESKNKKSEMYGGSVVPVRVFLSQILMIWMNESARVIKDVPVVY